MTYDEKEVLNMLIVQARSLTKTVKLLEEAANELKGQKAFIKNIFDEIKKEHYDEEAGHSDIEPLPTNVLEFPKNK